MLLKIILEKSTVKLVLKEGTKDVAETSWLGDFSLSERLLLEIDILLEKNNFSKEQVEKAVAIYDEQSSVTSARIVQTVADAWNAAR
ncbi:MAG TPA: hypothetical protein DD454_02050 [Candidatus Moranbacteria bacterium]|nr:hypothetical protein [Candidatus Moranbacteria bacterium]